MNLFEPIILGIVQGITEFLPISSSGHLVIMPWLFNFQNFSLTFDVALHFGTLLAIVVFFWNDWVRIFRSAFSTESKKADSYKLEASSYPKNLLWIIIFATIPGVIAGVLLEKQAETIFRNPLLIAINLAVFGIIIWAIDRYSKKSYQLKAVSYKLGFLVGLAQMLAIVPGVSRSGSTMAAGRAIGLTRPDSARFSFLLAAPIMLGTAIYQSRHVTLEMADLGFFLGIITSAIFGFIAIKYLLKYLQKGNYAIFTWYRIVLAIIVVVVYMLR